MHFTMIMSDFFDSSNLPSYAIPAVFPPVSVKKYHISTFVMSPVSIYAPLLSSPLISSSCLKGSFHVSYLCFLSWLEERIVSYS